MIRLSGTNKRQLSTTKRILVLILLVLQIIELVFRISQTLAKEWGLLYAQAIFYFVIIFLSGLIIFFLVLYKKWGMLTVYIMVILVLAILIDPIKNKIEETKKNRIEAIEKNQKEEIEDKENRFEKSDQIIGVIIADFKSHIPKDGANFAQMLYKRLGYKIGSTLKVDVNDTVLSVEIEWQRENQVWDAIQMKKRGVRRNASLGVVGEYRGYGEKEHWIGIVDSFKVVLIDSAITSVFQNPQPFGEVYEFMVDIRKINIKDTLNSIDTLAAVVEKACDPVEYFINMAGNSVLLQKATKESGWPRNRTLTSLHNRLAELGKLIENHSLVWFHLGNSLLRSSMDPQLKPEVIQSIYYNATDAYRQSIHYILPDSLQPKSSIKQYPEYAYLNLAWSFQQLASISSSTYLDSAEVVYDSVVARYPNREALEKQHTFLAERCEQEFVVQKAPSRIKRAELLYNKYKNCAEKLETEIRTSSPQLSNKDRVILEKIEDNKKNFEAHLKKLQRLCQAT
jgi:hypothetical protein